ncbi:MAG: ABC transporter permease [Clostridium sp.]|nr:ABC transporter permease [Clostridium sp.]
MNKLITLLKMNMKLLLRNKGFLFFLCVTPIVSAVILNLKTESALYENKRAKTAVIELEHANDKAVYIGDTTTYILKVYDGCGSGLSEYLLESLAATGMFSVCRCDAKDMTEEQAASRAKKDAFDDRAGALLYLKPDFDHAVLDENYPEAFQVYSVSDDERFDLFETELKDVLVKLRAAAAYTGAGSGKMLTLIQSVDKEIPQKQVVTLSGKDEIALTDKQINQKSLIGYALAIITLGFLFCGVCVAHTVIEEQNNKVYTRAMLSTLSRAEYFFSKLIAAFLVSLVQTLILGICIFTVKGMDFGIHKGVFLWIIFCLGLIFCTVSLLFGILLGDVMSANYAVFAIWSISALLSGLYFSLDTTSTAIKAVSYLMPQRWFLKAAELLLAGDNGAYSMVLYITAAYLILCISVGSAGLKLKRCDT